MEKKKLKELSTSTETELKNESEASRRKVEKRLGDSQRVVDGNAAKIDAAANKVKMATSSSGKADPTATIVKTEQTASKENKPSKTQRSDTWERYEEYAEYRIPNLPQVFHRQLMIQEDVHGHCLSIT